MGRVLPAPIAEDATGRRRRLGRYGSDRRYYWLPGSAKHDVQVDRRSGLPRADHEEGRHVSQLPRDVDALPIPLGADEEHRPERQEHHKHRDDHRNVHP